MIWSMKRDTSSGRANDFKPPKSPQKSRSGGGWSKISAKSPRFSAGWESPLNSNSVYSTVSAETVHILDLLANSLYSTVRAGRAHILGVEVDFCQLAKLPKLRKETRDFQSCARRRGISKVAQGDKGFPKLRKLTNKNITSFRAGISRVWLNLWSQESLPKLASWHRISQVAQVD